jgi:dienelactone hydrolase
MNACLFLALGLTFSPADDGPVMPRSPAPERQLRDYLHGEVHKAMDARRAAIAALKTPEDVARRQKDLKQKFLSALGGFPERTPLNAKTVGRAQRDGYRIEKVIYESRPSHHVTATLYLPPGDGPFPGVIMPIGHSENAKAADYVQRGAILLAKNGMACLAYDPIGQGERKQLLKEDGKAAINGSTTEHTMIDVGALLLGECTATYRIWDGIRSLDYLASRPEIDPKRLGCTGVSGGGTLTSYLMALDDRIVAAAPSCYVTTLERLFAMLGPQDAEQNIPGQVAFGMDHGDYVFLRAPRPTLMLVATRDFFDIDGAWTTFREAKGLYGLMGFPERMEIAESNTTHGYPREHREPMARWMSRWLLEKDAAIVEHDFSIAADADLLCTSTGQVLSELKGKSCFDINREKAEALASERAKKQLSTDELRTAVLKLLALPETIKPARRMELGTAEGNSYQVKRLAFEIEPGYAIPAVEYVPKFPFKLPVRVMVGGEPLVKFQTNEAARERAINGGRVLKVDLSGLGELSPDVNKTSRPSTFGPDVQEAFLAQHLNRPLLGLRVRDLLAVLAEVAPTTEYGIELKGTDRAALAALHAAALDSNVREVEVERPVISWTAAASTPLTKDQFAHVVPGALKTYDLPDLARLIAPRSLVLQDVTDVGGEQASLDRVRETWKSTGPRGTLRVMDSRHPEP